MPNIPHFILEMCFNFRANFVFYFCRVLELLEWLFLVVKGSGLRRFVTIMTDIFAYNDDGKRRRDRKCEK